jgi:hypothetical protein
MAIPIHDIQPVVPEWPDIMHIAVQAANEKKIFWPDKIMIHC